MSDQKWMSMLGLAARARMLVSGEELVIKDVRAKKVKLVLLSSDASESTRKKVVNKCEHYHVPLRTVSTRDFLGHAIGKGERVVIGVIDPGFAKKLITLLDQ
ncbi:YlxQ family RNA-binding protein [Desertibacillus haloalkaliphilus]|uniref:YlxQ family RNA-binding protein n=1 Tax=Desertibacillus haloalkaliphilus TaxID=1328930 RepID=UPI001C259DDE|nr:YlxQ family RNA-binding protein [Desertibacillus haloalkaliphilus]MBU8906972.1 YlxQ family RNA-binding protein [Desertibacillus haloalkaliphilus]